MGAPRRILLLTAVLAAASSVASGYAHWVFFANRSAPFTPVPASFNLASLNNNTVPFFISDQTPAPLMPGDSVANIVSQIQAAAAVWNTIPTSAIRVAFGGYAAIGQPQTAPQAAPGIDVIFSDEVTPGLLAQTSLSWQQSDVNAVAAGATFVPIRRSTIMLRKNLTTPNPLASYDDLFFMMVAHEFGHALGLQHTLTSAVMATQYTSATTKSAPLSADDIAGLSLLYPTQGYSQGAGSIQGTVNVAGLGGVNMANVVAVAQNGTAVSTLSNPDGTFQIQGVPPGQYYVYAGPLPPPQRGETTPDNIVPPQDSQGNPFPAQTTFDTEFLGGTHNLAQAATVTVSAGAVTGGVAFNLQKTAGPAITYISVFDYVGSNPVPSPPLVAGSQQALVFGGPAGITGKNGLMPGLSVAVIGAASIEPNTLGVDAPGFAYVGVQAGQVSAAQPVALVLSLPNDMYVLPYAFSVVPNPPPAITGVTSATDGSGSTTVTLQGTNLNATTGVVFDGAAATVLSANSDGSLTVAAPQASAGYTAYIEALSNDGQTSWQNLYTGPRPTLTYPAPQNPSITVNYGLLLPGATSMLDIIGINTCLSTAPVTIGLGSSDITVGRIWPLSYPGGRVLANVSVSPQAQPGPVDVTVSCGLQTLTIPGGLQVQVANPNQMTMIPPVYDQATGLAGTPVGGVAVISTAGLPSNLAGWTVTLDFGFPATPQVNGNLLSIQVPPGVPAGAAIVELTPPGGGALIPAVVMQVDAPDPIITGAANGAGPISASNPAQIGGAVTLAVSGLTQSTTGAGLANAQITVGGLTSGVVESPLTITLGSAPDSYLIQFTLSAITPSGPSVPVQVGIGTRVSAPFNLAIAPASLSTRR